MIENLIVVGVGISVFIFILTGIKIVRPIEKGLIERFGKYKKTAEQGFHWIIPIIDCMRKVNITEQMTDVPEQTVQTSDKLNTKVDAMVYYQVDNVKKALYNVDNHKRQLTSLARTTLRAVMGNLTLTECIQKRNQINADVEKVLDKETDSYGVKVLRVEVQKIDPPIDVQEAMNNVVKAEQAKISAKDYATAKETEADGLKRAEIKKAEGVAEAKKKIANGQAEAIKLINTAADKYFKGNAKKLKELEVTQASLENNSKIILCDKGTKPNLLIGKLT